MESSSKSLAEIVAQDIKYTVKREQSLFSLSKAHQQQTSVSHHHQQHDQSCSHDHGGSHNHSHSQQQNKHGHDGCSHDHGGSSRPKNIKKPTTYSIIYYVVFTSISCLYLETQHLNPLIGDYKAEVMSKLSYISVFLALWSYFRTLFSDSGIVKLNEKEVHPYAHLDYSKKCQHCNYWKGPRVSHCSASGKCIYKFDHFCIWIQTHIGYCNQRPFYLFCFYMALNVFEFWYSTFRAIAVLYNQQNSFYAFEPSIYILWFVNCLSATLVGAMILLLVEQHTRLIATNFTTLEEMKNNRASANPFCEARRGYHHVSTINFYDRGEVQNIKSVFGNSLLTAWLPFCKEIENQHQVEPTHPIVDMVVYRETVTMTSDEANSKMVGKSICIGDKIIQI